MAKIPAAKTQRSVVALALIYLVLFLTILWLAYAGRLPPFLDKIPAYDKIGHVVLYAVAAYLGHRVCRYRRFPLLGQWLPTFPVLFTLFTLGEELVQALSPHRTLDAIDLVASLAGIILGAGLAEQGRAQK